MSSPDQVLALAKKTEEKASSKLSSFFSGASFDDAAALYEQAANSFKLHKDWTQAGGAFCKAAEVHIKAGDKYAASNAYQEAFKSYKQSKPELAAGAIKECIKLLSENLGKFNQAAQRQKDLAQLLQKDSMDLEGAWQAYEKAGEWYENEGSNALANSCYKEVAEITAKLADKDPSLYQKAIERFESLATSSLDSRLAKYNVKEYYFKAGICHLCKNEPVAASRAIEKYASEDSSFKTTNEYHFLVDLTKILEEHDLEAFGTTLQGFEKKSGTRFDGWMSSLLLRIQDLLQEEDSLT